MDWDRLAEVKSQEFFIGWLQILSRESPALPLKLAGRHCSDSRPVEASGFITGAYNICSIVTFEDGFRVVVRFPILGRSRFRTEKSRDEVAGTLLSKRLRDPTKESLSLDLNLSDSDLQKVYHGMACILLELAKLMFPAIGGLELDSGIWKVSKRPLTLNMNELVCVGNLPPNIFAKNTFQTASEYFQELATQQFLHLHHQRNDAVEDGHDCCKKYIAWCLFRRIAREIQTEPGPFHFYCDDLCPSNVLTCDPDFMITGVIDWEFTYVAPAEFTYTAPWWLLLESPEAWESDLNAFLARYKLHLKLFLKVL
ncbi:hypothetical protein D8B26_001568 [Coccidioides posadasii str. Silveira]|uniref:Uncharacterized protein n=1 Tax=Coccidioides posadasii (strain RMSCC 757 / Silveira) TaxID=443226 RepID=E9CVN2_COCPS|nr:conserved hypothetical protein [Coccidioides posadasii str. Silveira]QVM06864.1 hypothetical protein D8B26_001568 [Coccidioides posadasii str. Silveira]